MSCSIVKAEEIIDSDEVPEEYIVGITNISDIEYGYTYQKVRLENGTYLDNVVIGDNISFFRMSQPNVYNLNGVANFSSLSGSVTQYYPECERYRFVANSTILIELSELVNDHTWLLNEEYNFVLSDGSLTLCSKQGGYSDSFHSTTSRNSLISLCKFINGGVSFRPLSNEIVPLDYEFSVPDSVLSGSIYHSSDRYTDYSYDAYLDITDITGECSLVYTGDLSGKKYYLAVTFSKGYPSSSSTLSTYINKMSYIDGSSLINPSYVDSISYSGSITVEYSAPATADDNYEQNKGFFEKMIAWITGFFDNLMSAVVDALSSLFIPSDGFFGEWFSNLNYFLSEKLGLLYAPIDIFVSVLETIASADGSFSGIPFPEIEWEGTVIISAQTITFPDGFDELRNKIYFVTDVIMVGAVLWLFERKLSEVLHR